MLRDAVTSVRAPDDAAIGNSEERESSGHIYEHWGLAGDVSGSWANGDLVLRHPRNPLPGKR